MTKFIIMKLIKWVKKINETNFVVPYFIVGSLCSFHLLSFKIIQYLKSNSMRNLRNYSDCDSSQEEDEVNFNYFDQIKLLNASKSVDHLKHKIVAMKQDHSVQQPEQQQDFQLKPKLSEKTPLTHKSKPVQNNSTVFQSSQLLVSRRPLTAAYTFKLKTPLTKKKKNDPVSLFQQTSQVWKKDKFLTSRGDNKEGRKLELDRRNKQGNKHG